MKNVQATSTVVKQEEKVVENKVLVKTQVTELGKASNLTFGGNGKATENTWFSAIYGK